MIRIGQGVDAHRFSNDDDRPLVLGGVVVEGAAGLEGHSDADVASHALCDAVLGAAGLGDLGRHFPADPAFEGIDSLELVRRCCAMAREAGWALGNAQVTVLAQQPRLAGHLDEMASTLSRVAGAPVAVTATTTDGLGAIGRAEGIAATAVALLVDATRP